MKSFDAKILNEIDMTKEKNFKVNTCLEIIH